MFPAFKEISMFCTPASRMPKSNEVNSFAFTLNDFSVEDTLTFNVPATLVLTLIIVFSP